VALKGEEGGGVCEWGKHCGGCWVVALMCVWVYFCCCSVGQLCRGLQLCKFGIVGWSAGGECIGGRGSPVTG
jgi:hypothetical protein